MSDPFAILAKLSRPKILVGAAQISQQDYRRDKSLRVLLPDTAPKCSQDAFKSLVEEEARVDEARRAGDVTYSPVRHIQLLTAMIAEARLIRRSMA